MPASRPQGSRSPQALLSLDCNRSYGSWKLTPGKQAPELLLPSGFDTPCLQQLLWFLVTCANQQAPGLWLPKCLVPSCLQSYCTAFLKPTSDKQAPVLLLPKSLVYPCLQQLLWLLVSNACKQAPGLQLPTGFVLL
jgi:hypothetical protein